jgi:hypothetical protein
MPPSNKIEKEDTVDLLNRCWMTHDGMWFYHCFREFGIEKANKLNKAAIKSLAPVEMKRIKKALGIEKEPFQTFEEVKSFFISAAELVIPDFMNAGMSFPEKNILHWEFKPKNCFAYKGMMRINAIDQYECGVIYRLECWFDSLGIKYSVSPQINRCLMLTGDNCCGDFKFNF